MKIAGRLVCGAAAAVLMTAGTAKAGLIVKPPDQGAFWQPLGPNSSYAYGNSFVADESGPVDNLGLWLLSQGGVGAGSDLSFEVWGSIGGNVLLGPDSGNVIVATGLTNFGGGTDTLDLYKFDVGGGGNLVAGQSYWFVASAVGANVNQGNYTVGAHTQNSVYQDNGTFWFSNDPNGNDWGGNATPEMAFSVNIVPAPAAIAMLGLAGLVGTRRRRR